MFKNSYQHGLLTVFCANCHNPLALWRLQVKNGHIQATTDVEIKSQVLDITGLNVSTTFIICPKTSKESLGIHMPYMVMIIKNLHKYFSFEVTILDENLCRRRFRVSNFQSTTTIDTFCTAMPIGLSGGWNQIHFNIAEFTRRAYKLQFYEVVRIQVNANIRIRRIYFSGKLYTDDELPAVYKLFFPIKPSIRKPLKPLQADNLHNGKQKSKESLLKEQSTHKMGSFTKRSSEKLSNTPLSRGSAETIAKRGSVQSFSEILEIDETTKDASHQSKLEIDGKPNETEDYDDNENAKDKSGNDVTAKPSATVLRGSVHSVSQMLEMKEASKSALFQSEFGTEEKQKETEDYKNGEHEEDKGGNDMPIERTVVELAGISSRTSIINSELSIIREESTEQVEKEDNTKFK